MAKMYQPPTPLPTEIPGTVFLAGSIERGDAYQWQALAADLLLAIGYDVFNPRRDSWKSMSHEEYLKQVQWELAGLAKAERILMAFDPDTTAATSLIEFGLYARSMKLVVVCPEGYWHKRYVKVVCHRYGIPMYDTLIEGLRHIVGWRMDIIR